MSDFSSGAIVDDDLDLSAARGRKKAREAAGAKAAAWGGKGLNAAIGVSAAVMVAGIVLWGVQLSGGMVQTGMRNLDSWGLYITSFMFFVGLSAGGLIISSVPKAFGIAGFGGISKVAVMSSIACTVAAIGMVVVDLGQPARLWELFAYSNLGSPLMWDIVVLGTYLILSCVYLWAQVRADAGKVSHTALRVISVVALVTAVLVHSVTAWIFGLQIAKEGWYSAIMAPIFVASAMDSGLALLLCVLAALKKARLFDTSRELMASLAGLLATCIAVDAFFIFCEVLTMAYPGAAGAETLALMTSGPTSPFFWFEIVGGLVVPFLVLVFAKNRERTGLVVGASVLVIAGVLCKRLWLLFTSFIVPNVEGAPGVLSDGGWALLGSYAPTVPEVLIVLGVVSVGTLGFMVLGSKLLVPATETERVSARAVAAVEPDGDFEPLTA